MKTISNIIPNPLNVNKILNSHYSTSRFATSDYNGKDNTKAMQNHGGNIAVNRVSESGDDFYLGGIGEIGLVMQNVDLINNKIKEYKGTEIPLDGKFVSSTLYSEQDQNNKEYTSGNANNVWYYDVSYGMINHGQFTSAYRKLPLYKYDIKDFDSTEDDFDEYDDGQLITGIAPFPQYNGFEITENSFNNFYDYINDRNNHKFNIMNYFYYSQDDTLDNLTNSTTYNFFSGNHFPYIEKYPIYMKDNVYSMPLLPSYKLDNYYDCEFFIFISEFTRLKNNYEYFDPNNPEHLTKFRKTEEEPEEETKQKIYEHDFKGIKERYYIDLIYKKIKLVIKFGNGDLKEILEPFAKLNDCVIYKFHRQWLYDYMFINNQEIIISLVDYGADNQKDQVLVSKKIFFNLFKIMFYEGKYNNYDFRFNYYNYYPLKYPLPSKKKFLELAHIPYENINNFTYQNLTSAKLIVNEVSKKDPYINLSDISNNYASLNSYVYHNLSEGNNIVEWFIRENGNGLIQNKILEFSIENPDNKILDCYSKTFVNYDADGILESNINITKINSENITNTNPNLVKYNNFNVNGLKQIIYLPYEFNLHDVYGANSINDINFENNPLSIFEDYLYIYNSNSKDIKLFFTDGSHTLCENTRIINIQAKTCKVYRPSRHDNYDIIIKNCSLENYQLWHYQIYKPYINNSLNRAKEISTIINRINNIIHNNYANILNYLDNNMVINSGNHEIVKVPIYNYSIPLFGNIIIIS